MILSENNQNKVARLLGYYDDLEDFTTHRYYLQRDFNDSNYERILEIIDIITRKPTGDDTCESGGIDYNLSSLALNSSLASANGVNFDYNGAIRRLRVMGDALIKELSSIVALEIQFNKYRVSSQPSAIESYHA